MIRTKRVQHIPVEDIVHLTELVGISDVKEITGTRRWFTGVLGSEMVDVEVTGGPDTSVEHYCIWVYQSGYHSSTNDYGMLRDSLISVCPVDTESSARSSSWYLILVERGNVVYEIQSDPFLRTI